MAKVANIFIDGEIWPEEYIWPEDHATSLYRVRQQINNALSELGTIDRIKLNIFSPGGYCVEGWAIVDYLLSLGYPIDTLAYGQCASFGTVFHSMGETREISQHCDYVVHRPWDWFVGNDLQNDEFGVALKKETAKLFTFYSERIDKTVEELGTLVQKEDLKLSPEETIEYGFSTAIWKPSAAASTKLSALDDRKKKPSYKMTLKDRKLNPNAPKDLQTTQNAMAKQKKSLLEAAQSIMAFFAGTNPKALDNKLKDGRTLVTDSTGDAPVIGDKATIDNATAPDGDYTLDNNDETVVTVKDGEVSAVEAGEEEDDTEASSTDPVDLATEQPNDTPEIKALRKGYRELKASTDAKLSDLERRFKSFAGAASSQEPTTQANRQPDNSRNKGTDPEESTRESILSAHVEKFKRKPREEVSPS